MYELVFAKMKHWKNKPETNKNGAGREQVQRTGMGGCKHNLCNTALTSKPHKCLHTKKYIT